MRKFTLLLLLSIVCNSSLLAQQSYIYCGSLIDGKQEKIQNELTLIIEGDKIKSIVKGYPEPDAGAEVIDLKAKR